MIEEPIKIKNKTNNVIPGEIPNCANPAVRTLRKPKANKNGKENINRIKANIAMGKKIIN